MLPNRVRTASEAPLPAVASASIAGRFRQVRAATEALCRPLATDDYAIQSMSDASPAKWHIAHTSWFFEEFVLQRAIEDYKFFDDAFRYLFNSYYEAVGPRHARPERGLLSRPTVEQVWAYRGYIDEEMQHLLERDDLPAELREVVVIGLHHEQQHQELLLTDLKHMISRNPLQPAYVALAAATKASAPVRLIFREFAGGLTEVGHVGTGFCFDNELGRHRVYLEPFRLANRLTTNAEYLQFVRAGGYKRADLWLADGWAWVQKEGLQRPIYWGESLEQEFTLTGSRNLDPHAPVCHLSYFEADAFARWAGARLPTEFEWEAVAAESALDGNFVEDGRWHPQAAEPVEAGTQRNNVTLQQLFGDVWEWTGSAYLPYPRFRPLHGALGEYNGKFMVNQLVLRGGSCATPRSHIRATYRNFFYPTARWQFSGVRLAADVAG